MTSPVPRSAMLFCALSVMCMLSLWFVAVPEIVSRSMFVSLSVFIVGAATVAVMTVEGAQPQGSVAQLLYATESAPSGKPASQAVAVSSAWNVWQLPLDTVGRQRMLTVLVIAIILVVLFVSLA